MKVPPRLPTALLSICVVTLIASSSFGEISVGRLPKKTAVVSILDCNAEVFLEDFVGGSVSESFAGAVV